MESFETLRRAIARFSSMRVVVVGDVMLDLYEYCYTAQSKPIDSEKPGRRAYTAQALHRHPGGAGNVAANLAALGASVALIGVTGHDGHHLTLHQLFENTGIRPRLLRDPKRQTTTKNRLYLDDEYLLRRDDESTAPVPEEIATAVLNEFTCEVSGADAVILSDYAKGLFSESLARDIIEACRTRNIPVIVDFKPAHRLFFTDADIIAPNASEAEALSPGFNTDIESGARKLHTLLGCRNLVVTLGERGICGFDGVRFFHLPTHPVHVVDAVGCGDTVRSLLALGYAAGLSLESVAMLANRAAGLALQKQGTATVSAEELLMDLERDWPSSS